MPEVLRPDGAQLHFEVSGAGDPVLALAPGGVSSERGQWSRSPLGSLTSLERRFTVITMDQRHAGGSRASLTPFSYDDALADQLAVLDAAGARSAHVLGAGIGAAYALKLAYDAPARVQAVALLHPIGLDDGNTHGDYYASFNETIRTARAEGLEAVIAAAEANPTFADNRAAGPWAQRLHDEPAFRDALRSLGRELYITLVVDFRDGFYPPGKRFFSVNDVAVERLKAPLLVLPGTDRLHPPGVAAAITRAARRAETVDPGLAGAALGDLIVEFFAAHA